MKKQGNLIYGIIAILGLCAVVVNLLMFCGNSDNNEEDPPEKQIQSMLTNIHILKGSSKPLPLSDMETATLEEILPELPDTYVVEGEAPVNLILWSSPEKAGTGDDAWLTELCASFNQSDYTLSTGEEISVSLRSISSGTMLDYIMTGTKPDMYTPSSAIWNQILVDQDINSICLKEKLLGNTAGLFVSQSSLDKINSDNLESIIESVKTNELTLGFTNPYTSTTGLNFLAELTKASIDIPDLQTYIPFVSTTSNQLTNSALKGTFDLFVGEAQQYAVHPTLQNSYSFIPFGTRHDNPLYLLTNDSAKEEAARIFADYITSSEAIAKGKTKGFFTQEDYTGQSLLSGAEYLGIQSTWKENKDAGKTVAAYFVADTSGSMYGEPLLSLQNSLLKTMQYISDDAAIGLISYSNSIIEEMPLTPFDLNAKAQFKGAVYSLDAQGNTRTYEALAYALQQLQAYVAAHPDENIQPKIFLLSDGEANGSYRLANVRNLVQKMQIPIYTIGYNYHSDELNQLAELTESACLNADTSDVVTVLRDMFRVNL